jgi:hypothetical protein
MTNNTSKQEEFDSTLDQILELVAEGLQLRQTRGPSGHRPAGWKPADEYDHGWILGMADAVRFVEKLARNRKEMA